MTQQNAVNSAVFTRYNNSPMKRHVTMLRHNDLLLKLRTSRRSWVGAEAANCKDVDVEDSSVPDNNERDENNVDGMNKEISVQQHRYDEWATAVQPVEQWVHHKPVPVIRAQQHRQVSKRSKQFATGLIPTLGCQTSHTIRTMLNISNQWPAVLKTKSITTSVYAAKIYHKTTQTDWP